MKGQALTITELNNTLSQESKIQVIPFRQFKQLHNGKGTKLEKMVASINNVVPTEDGYKININNYRGGEKIIQIKEDGKVSINGSAFRELVDANSLHLRVNHNNNSIVIEKLMLICKCIVDDELPVSFRGLCVNVMDGSGNIMTADELGIKPDYRLENLEWTLTYRNSTHGNKIKALNKLTGHVYRYSANDDTLYQIFVTQSSDNIKKYLEANYVTVD